MITNALGTRMSQQQAPYAAAVDGLRSFDTISRALRSHQDTVERAGGIHGATGAGTALVGAFASYFASERGHALLDELGHAAGGLLRRLAEAGPEQLTLPLEV